MAKALYWAFPDAERRKLKEWLGLDTLVILAVNDENSLPSEIQRAVVKLTREVFRLGITLAKVKLKGIDGDPHKRWSMWFNSMQHEEPYQGLKSFQNSLKEEPPSGWNDRWCMAVVSSCCEMSS